LGSSSPSVTYRLDAAGLRQTNSYANLIAADIVAQIQSALLNKKVPAAAWYFGSGEKLYWPNDEPAVGGELWNNECWLRHAKSVPSDGFLLALIAAGDGVDVCGGSDHPFYLAIGNAGRAFRFLTITIVGTVPVLSVRRPHGTEKKEHLDAEQKRVKAQLLNDAQAMLLAALEYLAQYGAYFSVQDPNGEPIQVKLYPRVMTFAVDLLEKPTLSQVSVTHCPRCFATPGHFGSSEAEHACCENGLRGRRTRRNMIELQGALLRNRQIKNLKTATGKTAGSVGMQRYENMNQFLWFEYLFDKEHGIFDTMHYDDLHMLFIGWIPRMLDGLDNAFCHHYNRKVGLNSKEDVRQLVESLLQGVPAMTDGVRRLNRFDQGWLVWFVDQHGFF
jgi:hypothetical protein